MALKLYAACSAIGVAGVMASISTSELIGSRTGSKENLISRCCDGEAKRCHVPFAARLLHSLSCVIAGIVGGILLVQFIATRETSGVARRDAFKSFLNEEKVEYMKPAAITIAVFSALYLGLIAFSFFNMKDDMDDIEENSKTTLPRIMLILSMGVCAFGVGLCVWVLRSLLQVEAE